jgi:hypothetical protein
MSLLFTAPCANAVAGRSSWSGIPPAPLIVERQDDALPPYTRLGTKQNLERPPLQLVGDLDLVTADRAREALSVTRETRQERRGRRLEIANCPPIMPQWLFTVIRACRTELTTNSPTSNSAPSMSTASWRSCASQAVTAPRARAPRSGTSAVVTER